MTAIAIRPEEPRDHAAIGVVTQAAFADTPHSDGSEVRIIERLRSDGDLTLSLVAEDGERIVGHVAVSPVQISDGSPGWYGLGPIAILPSLLPPLLVQLRATYLAPLLLQIAAAAAALTSQVVSSSPLRPLSFPVTALHGSFAVAIVAVVLLAVLRFVPAGAHFPPLHPPHKDAAALSCHFSLYHY